MMKLSKVAFLAYGDDPALVPNNVEYVFVSMAGKVPGVGKVIQHISNALPKKRIVLVVDPDHLQEIHDAVEDDLMDEESRSNVTCVMEEGQCPLLLAPFEPLLT